MVDDSTERGANAPNDVAKPKCAMYQDFRVKVIPISTIKIVVIVWQIVYQV